MSWDCLQFFTHSATYDKASLWLPDLQDTGNLREENKATTGGLQEEAESRFHCFEGVRVGEKGG